MDKKKTTRLLIILSAAILVVDQVVKILVKTHMHLGEDIPLIGTWCHLHFVENEGFAFGTAIGGITGKYILTLFRIAAVAYNFDVDLWFLGAALVLFFLSFIFRYGEELQREADETL